MLRTATTSDSVPTTAFAALGLPMIVNECLSFERTSRNLWTDFTPHRQVSRYSEYLQLNNSGRRLRSH